jgi:hypothetical protein
MSIEDFFPSLPVFFEVTESPWAIDLIRPFDDVEQMSVDIGGPDRESILGFRKVEMKETFRKRFCGKYLA